MKWTIESSDLLEAMTTEQIGFADLHLLFIHWLAMKRERGYNVQHAKSLLDGFTTECLDLKWEAPKEGGT